MAVVKDLFVNALELSEGVVGALLAAPTPVKISIVLVVGYFVFYMRRFAGRRHVRSKASLKGKTVIITGANAGIGRETAVDLATRGARVIMACRNPTKAHAALSEVRRISGNDDVIFRQVDTSDLYSVRTFAEQILKEEDRLDILINNAGIAKGYSVSPEGFDLVMATNHVGHFLLTMTLIDLLKKSAPSRIINVSSRAHGEVSEVDYRNKAAKGVGSIAIYGRSKLANIHFSRELAHRLSGTGVTAYSLHPGDILSSIVESTSSTLGLRFLYPLVVPFLWLFLLSEKDGAQTTIHCAVEPITHLSGRYFANCGLEQETDLAQDDRLAKELWDTSCEATGVDPNKLPT